MWTPPLLHHLLVLLWFPRWFFFLLVSIFSYNNLLRFTTLIYSGCCLFFWFLYYWLGVFVILYQCFLFNSLNLFHSCNCLLVYRIGGVHEFLDSFWFVGLLFDLFIYVLYVVFRIACTICKLLITSIGIVEFGSTLKWSTLI